MRHAALLVIADMLCARCTCKHGSLDGGAQFLYKAGHAFQPAAVRALNAPHQTASQMDISLAVYLSVDASGGA